jgi:hypothetical protein
VLYRPRVPPSLFAAAGLGLRAFGREPWLVGVGLAVALARRAALWPAWAVAGTLAARAALTALAREPLDARAPLAGALALLGAPRFVALVAGLALAGAALGAALRVAYLAGALPSLAGAMAGAPGARFAPGVAFGFARVLACAALASVLDLSGALFGGTLAFGAVRITARAAATGGSPLLAAAVAAALTLAIAVPLALSVVADAAVARAAAREERPARAFSVAGARFLARPGTFLLAALAFGVVGAVAPAAIEAAGGLATGFAHGSSPLVLLGPRFMVTFLAVLVAAGIDLAWLGTVTALAIAEQR